MPDFIPGLQLSRIFFMDAVKPVLDAEFPELRYDAAVVGSGSEVLGFDTPMSTDHHWGPRVMLFVSPSDHALYAARIVEIMRRRLPYEVRGYPTSFVPSPGETNGVLTFEPKTSGEVNHRVSVTTTSDLLRHELAYDWRDGSPISAADWLTFPSQVLRTLTHGAVYHERLGALGEVRRALAYYPHDVWLYLMAAGWRRIDQEEPFVGRTGSVGDELGSRVIAARLLRDLMRLCFLIEREYAPYSKWFGTAFSHLNCASSLTPIFHQALSAESWREREAALSAAYTTVAHLHNALNITEALPTEVSSFHGRPFMVIHSGLFADALKARITDPEVKRIADKTDIGAIDQISDSTDLLSTPSLRRALVALYAAEG